jgi:hypothetical protein
MLVVRNCWIRAAVLSTRQRLHLMIPILRYRHVIMRMILVCILKMVFAMLLMVAAVSPLVVVNPIRIVWTVIHVKDFVMMVVMYVLLPDVIGVDPMPYA